MFNSTNPVVSYRNMAGRIRQDHVPELVVPVRQTPVTLELRAAAAEANAAPEVDLETTAEATAAAADPDPDAVDWGSVTSAVDQIVESESSESLSSSSSDSSDSSESVSISLDDLYTRPTSPHYRIPDPSEMEPFPAFVANRGCMADVNSSAQATHCVKHCAHNVCKKTAKIDGHKDVSRACTCKDGKAVRKPVDTATALFAAQVPAAYPYAHLSSTAITISLPSATALLRRLEATGQLSIRSVLPGYTKDTASNRKTAANEAEELVLEGVERTLRCILESLPNEARDIDVFELEEKLLHCVRWDCVTWAARWFWGEKARNYSIENLRDEIDQKKCVKVMVERAVEVTKIVVGALVWWDQEGAAKRHDWARATQRSQVTRWWW
jgi:hypothetical protein